MDWKTGFFEQWKSLWGTGRAQLVFALSVPEAHRVLQAQFLCAGGEIHIC